MEEHSSEMSVTSEVGSESCFDFESFCTSIKKCISKDFADSDDVELQFYLMAYEQLHNFFQLLGGAFQFVAHDVRSKIKILRQYWNEGAGRSVSSNKFSTVKTMVRHEVGEELITNPKYVSGCRTLLRLHRGLDFIRKFLRQLYEVEDNLRLGGVARQIYDETLADYHSLVVRTSARVAMQFLPTRIDLLNRISNNDKERLHHILEIFPNALQSVNIAYDRVQHIYSVNNLLQLP